MLEKQGCFVYVMKQSRHVKVVSNACNYYSLTIPSSFLIPDPFLPDLQTPAFLTYLCLPMCFSSFHHLTVRLGEGEEGGGRKSEAGAGRQTFSLPYGILGVSSGSWYNVTTGKLINPFCGLVASRRGSRPICVCVEDYSTHETFIMYGQ